jgi:predicted GIY-YIG superfamily endonuclease
MKTYWIYLLIDPRTNAPFYAGYTSNIKTRYRTHLKCKLTDKNWKKKKRIWDIRDSGNIPQMEIVAEYDILDDALNAEIHIIRWLRNEFGEKQITNISCGGLGGIHSQETISKLRKPKTEQHRKNISKGKKGKPIWTEEQKREIGRKSKGRKLSPERKAIQLANLESVRKRVACIRIDKDGNRTRYESYTEAANANGIVSTSNIRKAIATNSLSHGYKWEIDHGKTGKESRVVSSKE